HEKINGQSLKDVYWYKKEPVAEIPVPVLGPDLMDTRQYQLIKQVSFAKPEESSPDTEEKE
ncbi:MAG: hypothetical protein LLG42_11525, partial [Chloroflexi bacterium]|nr:hypothetical protein [Chloroflexota bacterium]